MTPPLFHPNLGGGFPLDQIADVGVNMITYLKLFGREIIFEVFQPMRSRYLNVTDRRTDRQTDRQTTFWGNDDIGHRRYRPQPYRPQSASRFRTLSKPGRPVRSGVARILVWRMGYQKI